MKTSKLAIHEKYTKDIRQEIVELINSLNLREDEERDFDEPVTSRFFAGGEEVTTTYCSVTNKALISWCPFTNQKEYTNIKNNWIHTPTLRAILKEVKKICQKKEVQS